MQIGTGIRREKSLARILPKRLVAFARHVPYLAEIDDLNDAP